MSARRRCGNSATGVTGIAAELEGLWGIACLRERLHRLRHRLSVITERVEISTASQAETFLRRHRQTISRPLWLQLRHDFADGCPYRPHNLVHSSASDWWPKRASRQDDAIDRRDLFDEPDGAWWPFLQLRSLRCISVVWLALALATALGANPEWSETDAAPVIATG
jgi:hypothetical protein